MGRLNANQCQLSAAKFAARYGRRLDSVAHGGAFRGKGGSGVCRDNAPTWQRVPIAPGSSAQGDLEAVRGAVVVEPDDEGAAGDGRTVQRRFCDPA